MPEPESAEVRRAPVQGEGSSSGRTPGDIPYGTVTWAEHEAAWRDYSRRYGNDQDAETIARRGGFGYRELVDHLGHAPRSWQPRDLEQHAGFVPCACSRTGRTTGVYTAGCLIHDPSVAISTRPGTEAGS